MLDHLKIYLRVSESWVMAGLSGPAYQVTPQKGIEGGELHEEAGEIIAESAGVSH